MKTPYRIRGHVFLIQSYSLHDGPGIRTTVFTKGCPLRCSWCQNPESWVPYPELMTRNGKCISCGQCVDACPVRAVTLRQKEGRKIDRIKCNLCFKCASACPSGALVKVGSDMAVDEVMAEIQKDELIHYRSGGGVTLSGGEPLFQGAFALGLLKACKERGIHTALDTCGYLPWPLMEKVLDYADLVLYDIKHMSPKLHKEATGKSNSLILKNLGRISGRKKVWLRIPLIPGYNDSEENMRRVGELGRDARVERVSLLPFNRLGEAKFWNVGREVRQLESTPPTAEELEEIQQLLESYGLQVTVGQ